jgi:hypothetical protein
MKKLILFSAMILFLLGCETTPLSGTYKYPQLIGIYGIEGKCCR